jgi:hypothetical protein
MAIFNRKQLNECKFVICREILIRVHPPFKDYAEWSLYLIIDFYDMNSPYGLLLTSKLIRQSIFPFCLFRRENNTILPERILTTNSKKAQQTVGVGLIGYYGTSTSSNSTNGNGHNRNKPISRFASRGSVGNIASLGLAGHGKRQKLPFCAGTAPNFPLNPGNNNSNRLHVMHLENR